MIRTELVEALASACRRFSGLLLFNGLSEFTHPLQGFFDRLTCGLNGMRMDPARNTLRYACWQLLACLCHRRFYFLK